MQQMQHKRDKKTFEQKYCIHSKLSLVGKLFLWYNLKVSFLTHFHLFMSGQYLEAFVRKQPDGYGEYCTERLRRLMANGERKEVPSWMELEVK